METVKKITGCQGFGGKKEGRGGKEIFRTLNYSADTIMVVT